MKNITKLSQNNYEIRISYNDALTGRSKRLRRRVEGPLSDAIELRDLLRVQAAKGDLEAGNKACEKPIADYLPAYLKHREVRQGVASSTLQNEGYALSVIFEGEVSQWLPSGIKTRHIDALVSQWLTSPKPDGNLYSESTIKTRLKYFRNYLKWVFKTVGVDADLLDQVEGVKTKARGRRGRALSRDEAGVVLRGIREAYPQHYALVYVLLSTGQRFGSVSALRWSDINRETITFAQSHYRGVVKEGSKTGKVLRLPMTPDIWEVLRGHRRRMMEDQHPGLSTGLVFPADIDPSKSAQNGYQTASTLKKPIKAVCEATGVATFTPHDLRRTYNTWALEAGVSGAVLRSITGHSSQRMTDHYYHGSTEAKAEVMGLVSVGIQH